MATVGGCRSQKGKGMCVPLYEWPRDRLSERILTFSCGGCPATCVYICHHALRIPWDPQRCVPLPATANELARHAGLAFYTAISTLARHRPSWHDTLQVSVKSLCSLSSQPYRFFFFFLSFCFILFIIEVWKSSRFSWSSWWRNTTENFFSLIKICILVFQTIQLKLDFKIPFFSFFSLMSITYSVGNLYTTCSSC